MEHAGNILIFAQIVEVPTGEPEVHVDPDELEGADPQEMSFFKRKKVERLPQVVFMLPIARIVSVRKIKKVIGH